MRCLTYYLIMRFIDKPKLLMSMNMLVRGWVNQADLEVHMRLSLF